LVGIDDDGKTVGVDNAVKLLEILPNLINQKTGVLPTIELLKQDGKVIISITVPASIVPVSYHGRYYVRSGSVTTELQGNQLTEFLLKRSGITWEEITVDDFTTDDLDLSTIERFKSLAKDRLPYIQQETNSEVVLQKLNLIKDGKYKRAAVLLFAKNPQHYFLQARIRIGRFLNEWEVFTSDIVEGNLFEQVDKTLEILRTKYLLSPISYDGIYRREKLQYPYDALREAVLNAVIHRDYMTTSNIQIRVYADKLLVLNDGRLPEEIRIESLKETHNSVPRNFLIADTFYKSEQIENWGRGTLRIIKECETAGLPEPVFSVTDNLFKVCFLSEKKTKVETKVKTKILAAIQGNPSITKVELARLCNLSLSGIEWNIRKLKERGVLERFGSTKKGYWKIKS
jgi:Predicted transcriptional regulator containing an HTH domain and an uncharacterized domain shared with the mammalian protein Schlafen